MRGQCVCLDDKNFATCLILNFNKHNMFHSIVILVESVLLFSLPIAGLIIKEIS